MSKFKKFGLFPILMFCLQLTVNAQIGANGIYKFVNLPPSSRTASLGGNLISVKDADVTLAIQNASLLNKRMHNHLALSYLDYISDINAGSIVYARNMRDSQSTYMVGFQYINYGDFIKTDEHGLFNGGFSVNEYNLFFGMGREINEMFSYGAQIKLLLAQYEVYKSFGIATDISGTYVSKSKTFTSALVLKNIGLQLVAFDKKREPLPFEIQLGTSFKPTHMPFRFSIIAPNLQRFDITYINTEKPKRRDLVTGQIIEEKVPFSEKIARHLIVGTEVIITENFNLRIGYNHQRRKEMTTEFNRGMVGYSFGVGIRVNKFHISYGRANFHTAAGSNTFTLTTNLSEFYKRKSQTQPDGI